jgi:metal-sulfur cluster biosynthetic enzyme
MSTHDTYDDVATPPEETTLPDGAAGDLEAARKSGEEATAEAGDASYSPFGDVDLEDDGMPSPDDLMNALRAVVDPEIGYNIVDLGLVYEVTKDDDNGVHILMTLTSMGCPLTELIHQQCSLVLGALPGVEQVDVEFTFDPPWSTEMMTDYVREELRAMGMNV